MKRSREINGLEMHKAFPKRNTGLHTHRPVGEFDRMLRRTYRVRDANGMCVGCFVNRDAWKVTPRQRRRFVKRLHKLGIST